MGKADFAEPLSVLEVRGAWLQVKGRKATGWVFEGNLASEKPTRAPAATLTSIDASKTNTVAAARPLSDAGTAYASRHSAANAGADLDWLEAQAAKVKAEDVRDLPAHAAKRRIPPMITPLPPCAPRWLVVMLLLGLAAALPLPAAFPNLGNRPTS